ncbi:selection and upkeep of intraepithelial T-cells protein 7-like [Suncus etruscus]|uniref:selection and upkeep of intraepithelial T-cells protein 7-like n=1 Tax=Suncus etruscus TaxID=109475 RepID=UPI0021104F50|nr:selection and upkeep of intraepithelial T-cells protein 7-like [Suncus etruscus]
MPKPCQLYSPLINAALTMAYLHLSIMVLCRDAKLTKTPTVPIYGLTSPAFIAKENLEFFDSLSTLSSIDFNLNLHFVVRAAYVLPFILVFFSSTEKWTVTTSTGHVVATVGGKAELSCQLSPSQSAEHLEIQWFRGNTSNTIHLYRGGHEVNEKVAPEYMNRTEFVKAAIGKGKVTLRLHNISVSDDGPYHCSFKDDHFSDAASINLSVAALGLNTGIHIQAYTLKKLIECNSGGWFPEPHMEWRNSKGEIIPHFSKSFSQDKARLFHMKMTLFLTKHSSDNITCYIFNPLIGKGRQTNVTITEIKYSCFKRMHSIISQLLCYIILGIVTFTYIRYRNPG